MKITKYSPKYQENVKDLLVQLQNYVISIDKYNLNIISCNYRDEYFNKMVHEVNDNSGVIFLALEDNKVLGMIAGYIYEYQKEDLLDYSCPKKAVISELIVNTKCRNNGTGQKLIEEMEAYFKNVGCEYVQLDVFAYNDIAKKFYKKNNYEERMLTLFKKL